MTLIDDFSAAQARVKTLTKTPVAHELLELYALYKQATAGDATGDRPGMLDFKGRAKYDAWIAKKGISTERAQQAYVVLVQNLVTKYE